MLKNQEQIKKLIDAGILIPFDKNIKIYHGRARVLDDEGDKDWKVNPFFDNSSNNTGNNNMNSISTLYAGTLKVAEKYALARANQLFDRHAKTGVVDEHYSVENYKIVPYLPGKYFIKTDVEFSKLNPELKNLICETLKISQKENSINASKMSRPRFEDQETYHTVYKKMAKLQRWKSGNLITYSDVDKFCYANNYSKKLATQVAGTINAIKALRIDPFDTIVSTFSPHDKRASFLLKDAPIDSEYILNWAKKNNIIGFNQKIYSQVIDGCLLAYMIFNTDVVGTEKQYWKREMDKNKQKSMFSILPKLTKDEKIEKALIHATPEKAVDWAMGLDIKFKGKSYREIFSRSANVYPENFIVAEHTETVLRVFEDSFRDEFIYELLPFIRLTILCHDIGKGFTEYFKDPRQKQLNKIVATDFLNQLGVEKEIRDLILFIIGESQDYTHQYIVRKDKGARYALGKRCQKVLEQLGLGGDKNAAIALMKICLTLQSCDGGAYTLYAVTRDRQTMPNAEYKNFNPEFSKGYYHSNTGLIKPKILYDDEEKEDL